MIRQSDVLDLHRANSNKAILGLNLIDAYSPLPEIFSQDVLQSIKDQGAGAEAFLLMLTNRLNHLLVLTKKRSQLEGYQSETGQFSDVTKNLYQTRVAINNKSNATCYYSGLMPTTVKSGAALKVVLQEQLKEYLNDVVVEQYVGSWIKIPPEQQSSLGAIGSYNRLGLNSVLGDRQWGFSQKVIIRFLIKEDLEQEKWHELKSQIQDIKKFIGDYIDSAIEQEIKAMISYKLCRKAQILTAGGVSQLGTNSWIGKLKDTTEVVL